MAKQDAYYLVPTELLCFTRVNTMREAKRLARKENLGEIWFKRVTETGTTCYRFGSYGSRYRWIRYETNEFSQ